MRLEQAISNTLTAELCRSRRLMKCMPELLEDQPDAGQVIRGSTDMQDHSPTRGELAGADSVVDAWLLTEVGVDELTADEFNQPVSDESDSKSDSDGGVQAHNPPAQEEDDFDSDRLR